MEALTGKMIVLALGNPLRGDDGIGTAVLKCLAQTDLPPDVTLLDGGTPGLETVLLLEGYRRAVIVDAAEMGCSPGEWRRFTWDRARLEPAASWFSTLHDAGLAEALTLGEALGILPSHIVIYGVQPEAIGWSPELSDPVRAAIPAVCHSILVEFG